VAFAKVMERLVRNKTKTYKFDVDRFYLRKLSELEVVKQKQKTRTSSTFAALGNLKVIARTCMGLEKH
jgi:hypothetical protein